LEGTQLKKIIGIGIGIGIALATVAFAACPACHASPVFVGHFQVDNGIHESDPGAAADPWQWQHNPPSLTGQEAAALLFGGLPSDYFISIDKNTITHTAHTDSWGLGDQVFAENYKVQTGTGYNNPFGGPATSAFVLDHNDDSVNFVFRTDTRNQGAPVTPEPNSLALLGMGGLPLLGWLRRLI
jgi:hypothetical protein